MMINVKVLKVKEIYFIHIRTGFSSFLSGSEDKGVWREGKKRRRTLSEKGRVSPSMTPCFDLFEVLFRFIFCFIFIMIFLEQSEHLLYIN